MKQNFTIFGELLIIMKSITKLIKYLWLLFQIQFLKLLPYANG